MLSSLNSLATVTSLYSRTCEPHLVYFLLSPRKKNSQHLTLPLCVTLVAPNSVFLTVVDLPPYIEASKYLLRDTW